MTKPQDILDFWFLPKTDPNYGKSRKEWFTKNEEFDTKIKKKFLEAFEKAEAGQYLEWTETKDGCIALIILFDQFPRNMFRGSPRAFSTDAKALAITKHTLETGFYNECTFHEMQFATLPFEHSEKIDDQEMSVKLFTEMDDPGLIDYAQRHYDIIKRFGRFPHRNATLGRKSTPEEIEFLKTPNSSF